MFVETFNDRESTNVQFNKTKIYYICSKRLIVRFIAI